MIDGTEDIVKHVRKMCGIQPCAEHEFARDLVVNWLDRFNIHQLQTMRKMIERYCSSNNIRDRYFYPSTQLSENDKMFKSAKSAWWDTNTSNSAIMILLKRIAALDNLNLTIHPHYDKRYGRKKQGSGVADPDTPLSECG